MKPCKFTSVYIYIDCGLNMRSWVRKLAFRSIPTLWSLALCQARSRVSCGDGVSVRQARPMRRWFCQCCPLIPTATTLVSDCHVDMPKQCLTPQHAASCMFLVRRASVCVCAHVGLRTRSCSARASSTLAATVDVARQVDVQSFRWSFILRQVYPEGNQSNNNQFTAVATGTISAIDGLKAVKRSMT